MQSFFVFQQIQPSKMDKSENNKKIYMEGKQSTSKPNLMILFFVFFLLVIGLSIALAFLELMESKEISGDAMMMKDDPLKSNDDEVNLEALAGTHTSAMIAKSNETKAVFDYWLACSHGVPHHRSLLKCNI